MSRVVVFHQGSIGVYRIVQPLYKARCHKGFVEHVPEHRVLYQVLDLMETSDQLVRHLCWGQSAFDQMINVLGQGFLIVRNLATMDDHHLFHDVQNGSVQFACARPCPVIGRYVTFDQMIVIARQARGIGSAGFFVVLMCAKPYHVG